MTGEQFAELEELRDFGEKDIMHKSYVKNLLSNERKWMVDNMDVDVWLVAAMSTRVLKVDMWARSLIALMIQAFVIAMVSVDLFREIMFEEKAPLGSFKFCTTKGKFSQKLSATFLAVFFLVMARTELSSLAMNMR